MMDGFVSLPVSEFEQFPMILQMILYSITGEASDEFADFCKLLYFHNSKVYDILHSFLPFLSKIQIKEETMSQRAEFEYDIRHVENNKKILDSNFKEKIPVVI